MLKEIRIHGRGGMGNVTAAEILAQAAFADGKYAQAFPMFGAEREGAPVTAFVRVSDRPIRMRQQIYEPDYLVIQDAGLMYMEGVLEGLKRDGMVIVNSTRGGEEIARELGIPANIAIRTTPALRIAMDIIGKPFFNVVMVGAFACASELMAIESVAAAIRDRYPGELGEKEVEATLAACEETIKGM
ncbi:MAG: pyruvate ferredoxin oxidoreductase subunit gamma [Candidatus Geothermincolia bacterium]